MKLDRPMVKHMRTAATRSAAGAGYAAGTALDLDDPNEVTGADSAKVNEDKDEFCSLTYRQCTKAARVPEQSRTDREGPSGGDCRRN